jgi:transposase
LRGSGEWINKIGSISRAKAHTNVVFEWRRQYRSGKLSLAELAAAEATSPADAKLLPVLVIDTPTSSDTPHIAPRDTAAVAPAATPCCEVEIGKRRVRIRGLLMERAELFLRDCLR